MISFGKQLRILLWKGFLIKKRQKVWLLAELLIPIILFTIIAAVRTRDFMKSGKECHFTSKGFPSAGLLPFVQGWLCGFSNKCNLSPTTGDEILEVNENIGNQSIVIRSIRAFTDILDKIGKYPILFEAMMNMAVEVVHLLANMNDPNRLIAVNEIFLPLNNDLSVFEAMGMHHKLSQALMASTFTFQGLVNVAKIAVDYQNNGIKKIFFNEPLPLFCDPETFDNSFVLPPNFKLKETDRKDLCLITMLEIVKFEKNINTEYLGQKVGKLPVNWTALKDNVITLLESNETIPMFESASKLFEEITAVDWHNKTQVKDALFCGTNPTDLNESSNIPTAPPIETPMDKITKKILDYVRSVTPGQATHNKMECDVNVAVNDDLNCSVAESSVFRMFRPVLSGYILVTPDAPVVRELVEKLNDPLRQWTVLRDFLFEYSSFANDLQESIHASELSEAMKNLIPILRNEHLLNEPTLEFLQKLIGKEGERGTFGRVTKRLTDFINTYSSCFLADRFRILQNESHMESVASCLQPYDQYFSGIVFTGLDTNATSFPDTTVYKIRHARKLVDDTTAIADSIWNIRARNRPLEDLKYLTFGFSFVQEAIDRVLIGMKTNVSEPMGVYAQQEPFPCVSWDVFNVELFLALFVMLSWMIPSCILVKNIVYEKEQRLKELMRIMGLGDTIHFISWAIVSMGLSTISLFVVAVILKFADIMAHINFTFLLFFLLLYLLSSIAMALLISTFFTNANLATAAASLLHLLFFFPWQLSSKAKSSLFTKFTLIFPQTTLGYGFQMLSHANDIQAGEWSDIKNMSIADFDVSMWQCLLSFVGQIVFFCILSWYISAIYPGVYGVSQCLYFPFTKKYWFPRSINDVGIEAEPKEFDHIHSYKVEDFEEEPQDVRVRVKINRLSKVYDNNTKALDSLSLRLYEDQITALLGHNGAGKTTTMSLLCGLYAPSSGTAQVYGRDLSTDMRSVRDVLGICPQYNVLFPMLTVGEQLKFYAALKGVHDCNIDAEVDEIVESIGLTDKANALSKTLSGGMKRRLCIGMALIGGSKFVILDEPTAGVDVNSRKEIWKLLLKHKQGRTILLSTHHMDEADVLSDRIAILAEGRLRSLGSSVYLKKTYGHSYKLTLLKEKTRGPNLPVMKNWHGVICTQIEETDEEVVYAIPLDTPSDKLEKFFYKLDEILPALNSTGYGISAPSLQQIFVSLAPKKEFCLRKHVPNTILQKIKRLFQRKTVDTDSNVLIIGPDGTESIHNGYSANSWTESERFIETDPRTLHKAHVRALLCAKIHFTKRSILNLTFQIILPIILLMTAEIYSKISNAAHTHDKYHEMITAPPLLLTTALFGDKPESYLSANNRSDQWSKRLVASMRRPPGVGVRCLKYTEDTYDPGCYELEDFNSTFHWVNNNWASVPYNVPQTCGCLPSKGWNCTQDDYPFEELPAFVSANTTEVIWDLTLRNISQFRMITRFPKTKKDIHNFIGGWSLGMKNREANKSAKVLQKGWAEFVGQLKNAANKIGMENPMENATVVVDPFAGNFTLHDTINNMLASMDTKENVKLWFNNKLWPSLPIYYNSLSNALLRSAVREENMPGGDDNQLGILTFNHPMNSTLDDAIDSNSLMKTILFRIVLLELVLCVIPAGFAVFLVTDRESHSLHLQLVSGLERKMYWVMEFLFDMVMYILVIFLILFCYWVLGVPEITHSWTTVAEFLSVFLVYGMCMLLIVFCLQRWFTVPALAFVAISIGLFFVGVVATLTVTMIEQLMKNDSTLETPYLWCSNLFLILPQYNLGMAIYRGTYVHQLFKMGSIFLTQINRTNLINSLPLPSLLAWDLMGKHLLVLICQTILAMLTLFLLEHESLGVLRRFEGHLTSQLLESQRIQEDDDVENEKARVFGMKEIDIEEGLVVKDLAKAYRSHLAVKGVSFAVQGGECFGLLGLNGAGKTTTFSMMTGKHHIGHGEVIIQGQKVERGSSEGFRYLGYCPQFDALNMKLTAKENLTFYARIRGVTEGKISHVVDSLLLSLHLRPYADICTAALSGGNRRKLSVAIALVNQPPVIMLDEPSAGMDPGSQQFLWSVISRLRKAGRAVILTSHSMEECEALCTRIAIMDQGRLRCIGGKQHLKNKFGEGYTLTMKLPDRNRAADAAQFIEEHVRQSKIEAIHCSTVFCHIPDKGHSVASILHVINKLKDQITLEDFALSQTTLDDIFNSFSTHKSKFSDTVADTEYEENKEVITTSPPEYLSTVHVPISNGAPISFSPITPTNQFRFPFEVTEPVSF